MLKALTGVRGRILPLPSISRNVKLSMITISLGLALIGFIAKFLKRKGRRLSVKGKERQRYNHHDSQSRITNHRSRRILSPNGDISTRLRKDSITEGLSFQRSLSGSVSSLGGVSSSTVTHPVLDVEQMMPLQLCQIGIENLSEAVSLWEDAIMKLSYVDDQPFPAISDSDTAQLQHRLENLLDMAYRMQDNYERQCEHHADVVALGSALSAYTETDLMLERQDEDSSDQDSFVSATDMANLEDLEKHREIFKYLPLYEAGLLELKYGNLSCRSLRTDIAECLSDTEYLAKLHGLRLAFEIIFDDSENQEWWKETGRTLIGDMLTQANKDPDEFYVAFDNMIEFVQGLDNWDDIDEELRGRGVKVMSFYDIVLEFIMMDAFDDLDNPPSTVVAVVQNRWLSNGFKERALATAIWSVLKAKRRMLKFPRGFISHFYGITEHVSPVMAWGFLGPESKLKDLCNLFRELILGFICDIFSFEKVRYTTVEQLAADIMKLARARNDEANDSMSDTLQGSVHFENF